MSIRLGWSLLLIALMVTGCADFSLPIANQVDAVNTVTTATSTVQPLPTFTNTPPQLATVAATATLKVAATLTPTATINASSPISPALILLPSATPTLPQTSTVSLTVTSTHSIILIPTATSTVTVPLTPTATLTDSVAASSPIARALNGLNLRAGPGTEYTILGGLAAADEVPISGQNAAGDWWQVSLADGSAGWVYAPLVEVQGETATVAVVETIPPPPTATPAPTLGPQPVATSVAENTTQPAAAAAQPAELQPTAPPAGDGPDFRVIQKRLWDVYENGGSLFGDSVSCGEKRQLEVVVVDANGVRLSGVAVQAQYGAREIFVTGSQGKGDGAVEFVLGSGQDVTVIRDVDGREVTSEMATGLVTRPDAIPYGQLIAAQYCTDDASCAHFVAAPGCLGHFSWTVIFQRRY